jgi:RNA polymerase sigma-70 factor (ECF subfamily)
MTDLPGDALIYRVGDKTTLSENRQLDAAQLFKQFAPFVAGFLLRLGVARDDLEDLMQEVFLVAHRNGGYMPGPAKPTTYLANIAFRAATSHRRKRQTRSFVRTDQDTVASSPYRLDDNPETALDQKQKVELLNRALEALDEDKRVVFVLAEVYGETVVSIASGLGIPVDTAYSRLRAARRLFREAALSLSSSEQPRDLTDVQRYET